MTRERYINYAIIKCADDQRDEALNVGLIVYDPSTEDVALRITNDFRRVESTLPNVPVRHAQLLLENAYESVREAIRESGVDALTRAHQEWTSVLRFSRVRSILAVDAGVAADNLFSRYVELHLHSASDTAAPRRRRGSRVVRSVRTRLQRLGYEPVRDFTENAQIEGKTRSDLSVPVWYPLRLKDVILVDAMETHDSNERKTLDDARLIAQKIEQTLRATASSAISVIVRSREGNELGKMAREIISSEGAFNGTQPKVYTYSAAGELDTIARELQILQTTAF